VKLQVALLGAGNLATSLVRGFIAHGLSAETIGMSDPSAAKLAQFTAQYPVQTSTNNADIATAAAVIILCVKPNVVHTVATELSQLDLRGKLIISVAAGITLEQLQQQLGHEPNILRAMPNIGANCGLSATGLLPYALTEQQKQQAEHLFGSVGDVYWIENEAQLDALTALSGSGPAYFFYLFEALQTVAEQMQLPAPLARQLILQTAKAAQQLASQADEVEVLRRQVTSPGGTTAAAIAVFEAKQFKQTVAQAVIAAYNRAQELAKGD
jgi:pyrroline-5-carboxylate reductase